MHTVDKTAIHREIQRGWPECPDYLPEPARRYWSKVVQAKRPSSWTGPDLLMAGQICHDMALVDRLRAELEVEGYVTETGKPSANATILDQSSKRLLAAMRAVQVHALATSGRSADQNRRNQTARQVNDLYEPQAEDEDLIARPSREGLMWQPH